MARIRQARGQASVALIAALPALALALLAGAQLVSAGHAAWSAGNAFRAATRAEQVAADPERAARRALAPRLRDGLELAGGELRLSVPLAAGRARVRLGGLANGPAVPAP